MESLQIRIRDAVEAAGLEGVSFRNDYSGRGMWGRKCIGVTGSHAEIAEIIGEVACQIVDQAFEEAIDCEQDEVSIRKAYDARGELQTQISQLHKQQSDNMGLDVIIYWPSLAPLTGADALPTVQALHNMDDDELHQFVDEMEEQYPIPTSTDGGVPVDTDHLDRRALMVRAQSVLVRAHSAAG